MILPTNKAFLKWALAGLALTLLMGCSSPAPSSNTTSNSQTQTEPGTKPSDNSSAPPANQAGNQTNTQKTLLTEIMQLAQQGKVLNCEFPAKTTNLESVQEKWGKADKSDYIGAAKGTYDTYPQHDVVFGFNKGAQIFEVRSFDDQLKQLSLSKVKEVFGTPAYTNQSNGQEIIGYTAGHEFKLLLVFPKPTSSTSNPMLDHYSVLYPRGTVNSMADDPGRQW